jgi:hypothetical protein
MLFVPIGRLALLILVCLAIVYPIPALVTYLVGCYVFLIVDFISKCKYASPVFEEETNFLLKVLIVSYAVITFPIFIGCVILLGDPLSIF